jgi:hypothetical protein
MTPCPTSLSQQSMSKSTGNQHGAARVHLSIKDSDNDDDRHHEEEEANGNSQSACCIRQPLHKSNDTFNDCQNIDIDISVPCHCHESSHHKQKSYKGLGRIRFGNAYPCMVVFSVVIYWTFVSLVPIYNKYFFQQNQYPYPIATAGIQLAVVSLLLAAWNIVHHWSWRRNRHDSARKNYQKYHQSFSTTTTTTTCSNENGDACSCCYQPGCSPPSWILGPHFWWKFRWCFPIGALFGLKYATTNLGLHLVPAPTHLLLQSTDLVWTVLSAWWINGEGVAMVEMISLAGCVAGSMVLGWQLNNEAGMSAPLYATAVNLVSPILLGLCLATLRLACTELMRPDNRVGGTVSSVELTSIKLAVSSAVGLMMACLMEGGDETRDSWWVAFATLSQSTRWGVLGGALLIAVFQVNCTFLTFLTSAVALGLVGQVKIIPQWLLAAFSSSRSSNFQFHIMNLLGAVLIMGSAATFAIFNWVNASSFLSAECDDDGTDEEQCLDNGCTQLSAVGGAEGKPLLLLSDANDFGTAVVRKDYCTMDESRE